ncbi:MAG: M1 family aminopeptidase, partial [Candidatus Aminicenantes bacterium]
MKNIVWIFCLVLSLSFMPVFSLQETGKTVGEFVAKIQQSIENHDIQAYLNSYAENLKQEEKNKIQRLFDAFEVETALFHIAHVQETGIGTSRIHLQVLFQNPYAVRMETWRVELRRDQDDWLIQEKAVLGENKDLYKVSIPSERVELADRIEIEHVDIRMQFKDALIFYDNIPHTETALLVVGDGHVMFSPSPPQEKHQLEMIHKISALQDRLEYVYVRCSDEFFRSNIKIVNQKVQDHQVSKKDINKARSLFRRFHSRSFTIENSLTGELLSFLPKGEEAVFEFRAKDMGNLTYIFSPFAEEELNLYQWEDNRILNLYSPIVEEEKKRLFISFSRLFEISDYEIDIHFNPKNTYLSGKAKLTVESKVESLDGVKLKLHPDLEVLRINDENKHELFYTRDKLRKFLYVYFYDTPRDEKTQTLEIFYRGKLVPEKQAEDVISYYQYKDRIIVNQPKFETQLYTRSSYWYPAPSDEEYFTARLKIIVPPGFSCIANGRLVERSTLESLEDVEDLEKIGSSVFVFKNESPIKYLSFIVGEFRLIDEVSSPLPFRYVRGTEIRGFRWDLFDESMKIFNFYQEKFGSYPFEKFTVVHRSWPQGGGHSPASFVILNERPRVVGQRRFQPKNSPVNLSRWKEYFIAHEIAHQWWGQGVSWGTYHDQWLSEGLAQFASVLYLGKKYGQGTYSQIMKKFSSWTRKKSDWGAIVMGSRISYGDFEAYQAIIYNKAALVLNMLKDLLGEDVFFRALREFFDRYKYNAPRSKDFFETFEEISGTDLETFFKGWFESYRLPEVKVTHLVEKVDHGYRLKLNVVQLKGTFDFPLWIEWKEDGERFR